MGCVPFRTDCCNLLTHDLICHGVLSPLVFKKYLSYRESLSGAKAASVSFRNKEYGWDDYAVKIEFSDGTSYIKSHRKDEITRVYLRNYALRPICYNCPFKGWKCQEKCSRKTPKKMDAWM